MFDLSGIVRDKKEMWPWQMLAQYGSGHGGCWLLLSEILPSGSLVLILGNSVYLK